MFVSRKNSEQPVKQTTVGARLELPKNVRGVVLKERVYVSWGLCMCVYAITFHIKNLQLETTATTRFGSCHFGPIEPCNGMYIL